MIVLSASSGTSCARRSPILVERTSARIPTMSAESPHRLRPSRSSVRLPGWKHRSSSDEDTAHAASSRVSASGRSSMAWRRGSSSPATSKTTETASSSRSRDRRARSTRSRSRSAKRRRAWPVSRPSTRSASALSASGRSRSLPARVTEGRRSCLPTSPLAPTACASSSTRQTAATGIRSSTARSAGRGSRSSPPSPTTARTRRWPGFRSATTAGASTRTRPTAAFTRSRSPARRAARGSRCRSRRRSTCCEQAASSRSRGSAASTWPATRPTTRPSHACGCASTATRSPSRVMTAAPETLVELDVETAAPLVATPGRSCSRGASRDAPVPPSVAPGTPWLGVLLPYTPLHHLLIHDLGVPLVMTSGNRSDEPIAIDDEQALDQIGEIADAFLGHDRPIHRRCEDSVVRPGIVIRRSRGIAPNAAAAPRRRPAAGDRRRCRAEEHVLRRPGRRPSSRRTSETSTPSRPTARSGATSLSTWRCSTSSPRSSHTTSIRSTCRRSGRASRTRSSSQSSTITRTRRAVSPSMASMGRRSRSSSTARATARTGRSGVASFCAVTSRRSSASRTSRLCRCPAARQRSGSRGAWPRSISSRRAAPSRTRAGPLCARA